MQSIRLQVSNLYPYLPRCSRSSNGLYIGAEKQTVLLDISVGPVQELWKFDIDHPSPPDKTAIEQKLSKVSYDTIQLENQTAFLADQGM